MSTPTAFAPASVDNLGKAEKLLIEACELVRSAVPESAHPYVCMSGNWVLDEAHSARRNLATLKKAIFEVEKDPDQFLQFKR